MPNANSETAASSASAPAPSETGKVKFGEQSALSLM